MPAEILQSDTPSTLATVLTERAKQYRDAPPEEIADLLMEAVDVYKKFAPDLSPQLQQLAKQEIEFLTVLYHSSLTRLAAF